MEEQPKVENLLATSSISVVLYHLWVVSGTGQLVPATPPSRPSSPPPDVQQAVSADDQVLTSTLAIVLSKINNATGPAPRAVAEE